jgi:hypothetical protein
MRTFFVGIFISIAIAATSQDHTEAALSGSPATDFTSFEPFVRGLAMSNDEVTVYRIRIGNLPTLKYPKPAVIVWTKEGVVTEQKDGEASRDRKVRVGQIDVYQRETVHSLRASKGLMRFTLIELKQSLRDLNEFPNKPAVCKSAVDIPQGGFACLIELAPNQGITFPRLNVNSFLIAVDSGKVRYTIPRSHWESQTGEGRPQFLPGYEEHRVQNLDRKESQFVLIVPPPAISELSQRVLRSVDATDISERWVADSETDSACGIRKSPSQRQR